jgi:DNA-binding NarL/FixJ family response regulator
MPIRVLIADDHGVVAEGLRYVVEAQPDMEVIACVQDGREAVRLALETRPNIVLIDQAMPQLNGTEATHLIRERCPGTHVIVLSMYSDRAHVIGALQAGASGYIVKKSAAKEVVEAIRAVHHGYGRRHYLSNEVADVVMDQVADKAGSRNPLELLSSRERQVLQMLAEGHDTAAIAAILSLSRKSVETYRSRMMEKLEIRDLASLVRFAIQHGITSIE